MMKGMSTVKVSRGGSLFVLTLLLLFALCASAQTIPNDAITESMKQYLHALNGGEVSEEKLTKQLQFMQKVRNLWAREKFQELRHKPLKEIIENEIGNPLFASSIAFYQAGADDLQKFVGENFCHFEIPQSKQESVGQILKRAIEFRKALKEMGHLLDIKEAGGIYEGEYIGDISLSPSGNLLAGIVGNKIKVTDTLTMKDVNSFAVKNGENLNRLSFSSDGRSLVTLNCGVPYHDCFVGAIVNIWDVQKIRNKDEMMPYISIPSQSLGFDFFVISQSGNYLVCYLSRSSPNRDAPNELKLYNVNLQTYVGDFESASSLGTLSVSPDETLLAGGGWYHDHNVKIWDMKSKKILKDVDSDLQGGIRFISFTSDGNRLVFGSPQGIKIWNFKNESSLETLLSFNFNDAVTIQSISLSKKSHVMAVGLSMGEIKFIDLDTKSNLGSVHMANPGCVNSLSFNEEGSLLAGADYIRGIVQFLKITETELTPDLNLIYLADPDSKESGR